MLDDDSELAPDEDSADELDVAFEDELAEDSDVDEEPGAPDDVSVCRLCVPVASCGPTGVNRKLGSISVDEPEPVCRRWVSCDDEDLEDELLEDDDELSVARRPARGGLDSLTDDDSPDEVDELDEESSPLRRPALGGLELSLPDDDKFEEEDVASRRWLAPEDEESESEASDLDEADPDELDPDEVDVSFWRRSLVPADPDCDEVELDDPV